MNDPLPHFVIIGAMKCGTSTMHDRLARIPGVFMSTPKEPNFFSDDENWARGMGWYRSLFASAPEGAIIGEASTHYTKRPNHPRSVQRIQEHLPNARFVYLMRHPIDRLVSHGVHGWTERRMSGDPARDVAAHAELVEYGLYAKQLSPYLEAFGPERVLPVFLERMKARPDKELERVARFVGVEGEIVTGGEDEVQNASSERLREGRLLDVIMDAPVVSHARRAFVPRAAREWVKDRFFRMSERPELPDDVRAEVKARFDADLRVLSGMLGLKNALTCDNFKSRVAELDAPVFVRTAVGAP